MMDRRVFLASSSALLASIAKPALASARPVAGFPTGFLWGAATSGHQIEGNNTASDTWLLENVRPTIFAEPSGDADNSFELWRDDLDLVKSLGLNSYRFSIEWARIEPERGLYSVAMLDHYRSMIAGCRERGLTPVVTFSHFTSPRWFCAAGGWTNPESPDLFVAYSERAARHLGADIGCAVTFNEPNLGRLLASAALPPALLEAQRAMLRAAARACGTPKFVAANAVNPEDLDVMLPLMIQAHHRARDAIKAIHPNLPVGVSLAMNDEQALGPNSRRDAVRADLYGAWLEAARHDDFIGVQNYERARIDAHGRLAPPEGAPRNAMGGEIYPASLAGAVRYAHAATGLPVLITEHGLSTDNDEQRAQFIPAALAQLQVAMTEGVPVKDYIHWSLLDNFEWIFGYKPKYGLVAVDRRTFVRTPKPSAHVFGAIAQRNAV